MERKTFMNSGSVPAISVDKALRSLRSTGYSLLDVVAEIVDNAIDAKASNIHINLTSEKVRMPGKKRPTDVVTEIAVSDDGYGMDHSAIQKCLVLGETFQASGSEVKHTIGKFGVGLTLGGFSLAQRIEVYSRTSGADFLFTSVSLESGDTIPEPVCKAPKAEYSSWLKNSSGTVVVLKDCDRTDSETESLAFDLGRIYRKYIERGVQIFLNENLIYLHDPLYLAGPTFFDQKLMGLKGVTDAKGTTLLDEKLPVNIPGTENRKAYVRIRLSMLPEEWRTAATDDEKVEIRKRKVEQNEGISILRADREIAYERFPCFESKKAAASAGEVDCWWGGEISFPPELDDLFHVKYLKRGIEPASSLCDQIRNEIETVIGVARNIISQGQLRTTLFSIDSADAFRTAELAMAQVEPKLPISKKGKDLSAKDIDWLASKIISARHTGARDTLDNADTQKAELLKMPYSIEVVDYPSKVLFEPTFLGESIVLKLNANHPFYRDVICPLCGEMAQSQGEAPSLLQQNRMRDAILMLLLSFAKAESLHVCISNKDMTSLRDMWGAALYTALRALDS